MISVLINAYACSPNMGSEPGMAWNWIINLANYCKVYVITEGEWKEKIEEAIKELPQGNNITFYYNPVSDKIRKMCWNQGDWRFYYFYKQWQKLTYKMALNITKENQIDILHQLNMIGFREPGYLWKIEKIPFIWGPIGGMETLPVSYLGGQTIKLKIVVLLKNIINIFQTRYSLRVRKAINKADTLVAAVKGVKDKIELYHNKKAVLINETGCYPSDGNSIIRKEKKDFDVIWVGKFDFRKQLGMALHTIANVKHLKDLKFHIIGNGSNKEVLYYKEMANKLGIRDICVWHGLIPNIDVQRLMKNADILFFTSIMEGTPHVVLEAIGNNLPVLCLNTCGQAASINESVGSKINVTTLNQSISEFAEKLLYLYQNKDILYSMSIACLKRQQELSWDNKAKEMVGIYEKAICK